MLSSSNTSFIVLSKGVSDDSCLTTQEYEDSLFSVLDAFSLLLIEYVLLPLYFHAGLLV